MEVDVKDKEKSVTVKAGGTIGWPYMTFTLPGKRCELGLQGSGSTVVSFAGPTAANAFLSTCRYAGERS